MLGLKEFGLKAEGSVANALSEAWQWLFTYGLVARDYTQTSSEAFQITRQGKDALDNRAEALAQVRAQAKINLVSVLHEAAVDLPEWHGSLQPKIEQAEAELEA